MDSPDGPRATVSDSEYEDDDEEWVREPTPKEIEVEGTVKIRGERYWEVRWAHEAREARRQMWGVPQETLEGSMNKRADTGKKRRRTADHLQ